MTALNPAKTGKLNFSLELEPNLKLRPFIRLANPGDEAGIHDAHMRSIREVCVKDHGEEEIRGWGFRELGTRWIEPILNKTVWVVESGEVIKGFGYINILKESESSQIDAYLHALYLTPEVIGQKFGSELMKLMLEKAKSSVAKGVSLESSITAYQFYKGFGFVDAGSMKKIEIGGFPVTAFPMRLHF